jgi:cell division protein FtsW (lipid II flippase)
MNIDFNYDAAFSWYVVLLCLSGVVMVVMAAVKGNDQSDGARAISALAGAAFLGYGIYLAFIFEGGTYWMFFQAFFLPVLLVINFVRSVLAKRSDRQRV